jgi:hypothetical protein
MKPLLIGHHKEVVSLCLNAENHPPPFLCSYTRGLIADILEDHPFETRLADLFANLTEANWNHISERIDRHGPDTDNTCGTKQ